MPTFCAFFPVVLDTMVVMKEVPEKLQASPRPRASWDIVICVKAGKDVRVYLFEFPHFDTGKASNPLRLTQNHTGG